MKMQGTKITHHCQTALQDTQDMKSECFKAGPLCNMSAYKFRGQVTKFVICHLSTLRSSHVVILL